MSNNDETILLEAIDNEAVNFKKFYLWLETAMPPSFFEDVTEEQKLLIVHNLMGFEMQNFFSTIHLKQLAFTLCLDSPDADLLILERYSNYGIKNYQAYISKIALPGLTNSRLRIGVVRFTEAIEEAFETTVLKESEIKELRLHVKEQNPSIKDEEFDALIRGINSRFLGSVPIQRLSLALDMFFRATTRDNCQYEVRFNEDWEEGAHSSLQIVLAWRNCPKHNFLYRIARVVHRHGLIMQRVNATYVDPYSKKNTLIMILGIHGSKGEAAWDAANIPDFLRELMRVKYFASFDSIDKCLVAKKIISGNMGNLIRGFVPLVHQLLLHIDPYLYSRDNTEATYCRNPQFTKGLTEAFKYKFDPDSVDLVKFVETKEQLISDVKRLDTGHESDDALDRNVILTTMHLIDHIFKTNFYRNNLTALSFRIDPKILRELPYNSEKIFPELPFGIFFMKGMHYFGFHIRFKDLARGGLRTLLPRSAKEAEIERNHILTECYNLAHTQHYKNKEIPEGGSKGLLFLKAFDHIDSETAILRRELEIAHVPQEEIEKKIALFQEEQKLEYLHASQRSYIESLLTLINCDSDGKLRAKRVIDTWKKPEYIFLGPDENMSNEVIQWIANASKKCDYKPGTSFISSKPIGGINHKEYGVTSLGISVYMDTFLRYIGINPEKEKFTVKLSGGPDGDVAGNMLLNLHKYYPQTAKVVALTDVSGTIRDLNGLDLQLLADLFYQAKPIRFYPKEALSNDSFLIDRTMKRNLTGYTHETLLYKKEKGRVVEEWLSGSEINSILKHNLHQVPADVFITAGGRPRTLNEHNYEDFLDTEKRPTSKIIVEGANLYLTPKARLLLENRGVYIVKDSSANKGGVICSSFEVLSGLVLGDDLFIEHKETLVSEILEHLRKSAKKEADLLIRTYEETKTPFTEISIEISEVMNRYKYQLLNYLEKIPLPKDLNSPLIQLAIDYSLPLLKDHYKKQLIEQLPDLHLKAIIAAHIASETLYRRGLTWAPSIVDILPIILDEQLKKSPLI